VLAFATCVEVGVKALGVRNIAATKIPLIRNNWFMFVIITRTIKILWKNHTGLQSVYLMKLLWLYDMVVNGWTDRRLQPVNQRDC
jgi:hypothetical protein